MLKTKPRHDNNNTCLVNYNACGGLNRNGGLQAVNQVSSATKA